VQVVELKLEWPDLFDAALVVGERAVPLPEHHVRARAVPLEDKIGLIVQVLKRFPRVEFGRLVEPYADRLHAVMTLLASLELSKRREVAMRQSGPFEILWLYRGKGTAATDEADADR
jgi:chromatin segregation and condensation protein Rec8/ScpA/Scc1 (kleisin family)